MRYIITILTLYFLTSCKEVPPIHNYTLNPKLNISKYYNAKFKNKTITVAYTSSINEALGRSIIYKYNDIEIDRYNNSKWSNNINKLITSSISRAIYKSKLFNSIIDYTSSANSDYILESRIYDFYHKVRDNLSLSVVSIEFHLIDSNDRVIKSHKFSYKIATTTKDARGYVQATNIAMEKLLIDMILWLK